MKHDLLARYARYSLADLVRGSTSTFRADFASRDLSSTNAAVSWPTSSRAVLETHEETYRQIWEESRKLIRTCASVDAPIPDALAMIARHVLEQEVLGLPAPGGPDRGADARRVLELVPPRRAELGFTLDLSPGPRDARMRRAGSPARSIASARRADGRVRRGRRGACGRNGGAQRHRRVRSCPRPSSLWATTEPVLRAMARGARRRGRR